MPKAANWKFKPPLTFLAERSRHFPHVIDYQSLDTVRFQALEHESGQCRTEPTTNGVAHIVVDHIRAL